MKKIFVVGMPRSGTTLVQTLVCAGNIFSGPESHIFLAGRRLFKKNPTVLDLLIANVRVFLRSVKLFKTKRSLRFHASYASLINYVDDQYSCLARDLGFDGYVEKTPAHLEFVPLIAEVLPGAKFIFVVRDMESAVRSYSKVLESWGKDVVQSLDQSVRARWVADTFLCSLFEQQGYGMVLDYNDINSDEKMHSAIHHLSNYIECSIIYDPESLTSLAKGLVHSDEVWKKSNLHGVSSPKLRSSVAVNDVFRRSVGRLLELL